MIRNTCHALMPLALFAAAAAHAQSMPAPAPTPGYLSPQTALAAATLIPPPPAPNTAPEIADRYAYAVSTTTIGTARWQAAIDQLDIRSPSFQKALSCAIGKQPGPATMRLLARAAADFVPPMAEAKARFARNRPFTRDAGQACDPATADGKGESLGKAYPSGHAGIGWLWGLILSEAHPARATQIRQFGQSTGDLRITCRVHWLSDVQAGRLLATALYQQQSATPAYQADLTAARTELAAAKDINCE